MADILTVFVGLKLKINIEVLKRLKLFLKRMDFRVKSEASK